MPSRPAALIVTLLAIGVAGCGGEDVGYEEVPGPPATLTVPEGSEALSSSATQTPTPTSTATADPNAAATTAPPTTQATAAPTTQPGGGTGAPNENEFDAFCNENPGACD